MMTPNNSPQPTIADDQAFLTQLYIDFHRLMFFTAGKYTGNPYDQEEIVQTSLLKMVKNISRLRQLDRCALPSFIVILTRNTAINYMKHEAVVSRYNAPEIIGDSLDPSPTPEEFAINGENRRLIQCIWPRLSESDRILLEGKYILGLSDAELSELVGCKASSVRMKLTRARRNALAEIRRTLKDYDKS